MLLRVVARDEGNAFELAPRRGRDSKLDNVQSSSDGVSDDRGALGRVALGWLGG